MYLSCFRTIAACPCCPDRRQKLSHFFTHCTRSDWSVKLASPTFLVGSVCDKPRIMSALIGGCAHVFLIFYMLQLHLDKPIQRWSPCICETYLTCVGPCRPSGKYKLDVKYHNLNFETITSWRIRWLAYTLMTEQDSTCWFSKLLERLRWANKIQPMLMTRYQDAISK